MRSKLVRAVVDGVSVLVYEPNAATIPERMRLERGTSIPCRFCGAEVPQRRTRPKLYCCGTCRENWRAMREDG